jgi:hypothetical protein
VPSPIKALDQVNHKLLDFVENKFTIAIIRIKACLYVKNGFVLRENPFVKSGNPK